VSFADLGLDPELLRVVEDQGYVEPTPVQAEAIPFVLAGRDLLAGAQTGTGKTAAFVLPILQLLPKTRPTPRHSIGPRPRGATGLPTRVLVVVPTRELALQVEESVRVYSKTRPVRSAAVYGGVGYAPQIDAVRGGPEILVATPGRLLDLVEQQIADLRQVEILVLDEADRMLDMGFIKDIRRIISLLPARRQNLLFSATFSDEIRQLASGLLHDPAQVQIAKRNVPIEAVRQVAIRVNREDKRDVIRELWASKRLDQALVFVRTKHFAGRLADQLVRDGIRAAAIHGDRTQSQRVRALEDFKAGKVGILVATDVASRGLDIEGLPHVINYELPLVAEDYIHRIGRTGRAGLDGDAISLVAPDDVPLLHEIEALIGREIPLAILPGFEPSWEMPEGSTGARRPGRSRAPRAGAGPRQLAGAGASPAAGNRRRRRRGAPGAGASAISHGHHVSGAHGHQAPTAGGHQFPSMPGERFANRGPAGS
jgi:ATP-dependent RNA helicase RhlE